ncbi:TIGR03767 family metallophosphoesterase [Aquihabitans sp. McL0605]|uniref:TIGR03767 family metallophosphoesterase n=1 Tax=Aquihabitans sp. McL0605 TaxID=3415671 RepID=UPI003CF3D705
MGRGMSRRRFLAGSAGAATAASIAGWTPRLWAEAQRRSLGAAIDPAGTTLALTIVASGNGPYRTTAEGPAEPTLVRAELQAPSPGREDRRTVLAAFVHFTDQHLIDAQCPGRVEFLDPVHPLFQSAFRPQELLTTQVATSMVERVNQLGRGPITGRTFDCVVCTGDNVDNQQRNEMEWFLTILDGGAVTPDSGAIGTYEGVQDAVDVRAMWWHPDAGIADSYKANQGYPDVPGLLTRAIAPFSSPGLDVPWFSVYGNHDCNIQGNAARSDAIDEIFTGDRKMSGLKAGEDAIPFILRVMGDSPSVLADLTSGALPYRTVTADPGRRTATVDDWIQAHLDSPTGHHGYGAADLTADRLYYEFPLAPGVVGIALDSTNHAGGPNGSGGSIGAGQAAWLEQRLAVHHARHLAPDGTEVRSGGDDQLVIVFSHHTPDTMDATDRDPAHPQERRVLGAEVVSILVRYPNVVAWVNGHTHTNGITPRRHPQGLASGFWEICTASHVDWPQQARVIELVDNADGTLSIFGTMIEHLAPATVDRQGGDVLALAGLSRELGLNDANAGPASKPGAVADRNVELVLPTPFLDPAVAPATSSTTSSTTTSTTAPGAAGPSGGAPAGQPAVPVEGSASYTG